MVLGPASFEPTFLAIGKILELSDKISQGRIFEVDFEKNVKNVSKKNKTNILILYYVLLYDNCEIYIRKQKMK